MEKVMQSILLSGAENSRLLEEANQRIASLLCTSPRNGKPCRECRACRKVFKGIHPDVTLVGREMTKENKLRREIVIEQIRQIEEDSVMLPNEARFKFYVISEAETMNENAQNALLKVLEEPPAHVIFMLCASNAEQLLPTIRSRCTTVRVRGDEIVPEESVRQRAIGYLESLNDALQRYQFCSNLEKSVSSAENSISELSDIILALRILAPEYIRDTAALLAFESEMERMSAWLRVNAGYKHVIAMLATYEMRKQT